MNIVPGIDILNTGTGHTEITFTGDDSTEKANAARMIGDMIRRGYGIFIHGEGGVQIRVHAYDPEKHCYIVHEPGEDPTAAAVAHPPEHYTPKGKLKKKYQNLHHVPVQTVRTTAIGRSAGG